MTIADNRSGVTLPQSDALRLFAAGPDADVRAHGACFGPVPDAARLVAEVRSSGLTGRGGGGFPAAAKIEALAGPPGTIIANASEGEPLSRKDVTLLHHAPHLVIDGMLLLASALSPAARLVLVVHPDATTAARRALDERSDAAGIELRTSDDRFVSGEATAVVASLSGRPATPTDHVVHLTERGLGRRPTLLFNAETMAHIALIARYGGAWFRAAGASDDPGSRLVSISGDGVAEQVREVAAGMTAAEILGSAGVDPAGVQAVLVGGFHGSWLRQQQLSRRLVARPGGHEREVAAGAGILLVLGPESCGLRVTGSILRYLAAESAGQCGPCVLGLPRLSERFDVIADGRSADARALWSLIESLPGRGACHHPDGTTALARSALAAFADEVDLHRRGGCTDGTRR